MTDDNNHRYRSGDPYAQQPGPDNHGSDPLAELARLIGQSDAFHPQAQQPAPHQEGDYQDPRAYGDQPAHDDRASYGNHAHDNPAHYDDRAHYAEPQPAQYAERQPYDDRAQYGDRAQYSDPVQYGDPAQYSEQPSYDHAPRYRDEPAADHAPAEPRYDAPFDHRSAFGRDAHVEREEVQREQQPEWQLPSDPAMDRLLAAVRTDLPLDPPQADQSIQSQTSPLPPAPPPLFDFGRPSAETAPQLAAAGFAAGSLSAPGQMPPPNPDEFYDDAPSGGRRRGMVTVFAVLALAVLGTGAAFGYRTFFGGPTVKSPPPVIRASAEPNKVAPPPQPDKAEAAKITYDRFADRGQNEKIVAREEKPVDVSEITRSGPPSPATTQAAPAAAAAAPPPPAINPPSVLTEPKRVRTVPVRPNAPDSAVARSQMAAAVPPMQQPVPQRQAPVANAPLDLANPQARPQPQVRAPAPPVRTASRAPEPPPGTAPLSLAPESSASVAPSGPAPRAVANGNYLVQVSSQRSEADAQAAFRTIRSRYSSLLGSQNPVIRRADIAGRGTFYRAMVGPFASRGEAVQLCSSLKAAGGDCVVQSN